MEAMTVALTTATIFFPMTACARVTKSTEGKIEKTTVACVPFFTMGQKNNA